MKTILISLCCLLCLASPGAQADNQKGEDDARAKQEELNRRLQGASPVQISIAQPLEVVQRNGKYELDYELLLYNAAPTVSHVIAVTASTFDQTLKHLSTKDLDSSIEHTGNNVAEAHDLQPGEHAKISFKLEFDNEKDVPTYLNHSLCVHFGPGPGQMVAASYWALNTSVERPSTTVQTVVHASSVRGEILAH